MRSQRFDWQESFAEGVGGFPFLYADTFMTEREFEKMFDLGCWRRARSKYGADKAFATLYDKAKPEVNVLSYAGERL